MKTEQKNNLWVWVDLEMTGLDSSKCVIVEIASVVTDTELNIISLGPDIVIGRTDQEMATLEDWPRKMHKKSGLLDDIENSKTSLIDAEKQTFEFISQFVVNNSSPLCGNSVYQDRIFLKKEMPELEKYLHYRNLDVSSFKESYIAWGGDKSKLPKKESSHRAMSDIIESINELKWYKENFISLI